MACSFTSLWYFIALLAYCFAEKEYIFEKGDLYGRIAHRKQESASPVHWMNENGGVYVCGKKPFTTWLFLKPLNTRKANQIVVEIEYRSRDLQPSQGLYIASKKLAEDKSEGSFDEHSYSMHLIQNTTMERTVTSIYYHMKANENYLAIALQAVSICAYVYNISIFYYVCPKNETLGLKRTLAPSQGFLDISKNCSMGKSGKKGSVVVARCDSLGVWHEVQGNVNPCTSDCEPGAERLNDTCVACKGNYYKGSRGTEPCKPCPLNSVSSHDRTRCECKKNYRNAKNGSCKTIAAQPENLHYWRLPGNDIELRWNVSREEQGLHFTVKCSQLSSAGNSWGPCLNLPFGENGKNVTETKIVVKKLANNTKYNFSVTSLNDVSDQFVETKWLLATIHIELPGPTSMRPSTVSQRPMVVSSVSLTVKPTSKPSVTTSVPSPSTSSASQGHTFTQVARDTPSMAPYIGAAIGALILIFVVVVILVYRVKFTKKETLEEEYPLNPAQPAYVDPARYGGPEKAVRKFAKEIDRRQVKLEGLIGEGEFAKVHKGMLCRPNEPPVPVALKVLKPGSSARNREDFLTEAAVMGQFKDLNIVNLEGVVTISRPVVIITEFMHNGALSNFLLKNKNRFCETDLLAMARGIASGMKYLARMRYVHRDLAARNVLVNENMVCKVADFGLTRELEESCQGEYVTQGGKIPIRWTAPEAYKHRRFTTASDVWSFGIVLWEIMSYADRPYGDWDNYMVMDQVTADYRLTAPTNCPKIVHQLMMECWKADRSQRPSFSDIVEMLDRWIRNPYLLKDYQYVTEKGRMEDRKSCVARSIREHLETIKMDRYFENFIDFGYTELYQIQSLTDDDLVGIGVPLVGHRNKIIKSLRGGKELILPVDV